MAASAYINTVQQFYVAYYGRPADPAGLAYWTERLDSVKGNLAEILNAFGTSAEATRLFGSKTNDAAVDALYQQIFGRAPDAEGKKFYVDGLNAKTFTLADVAKRIVDGTKGDDVAILNNKTTAANAFTTALDTDAEKAGYNADAETTARTWLSGVSGTEASLTTATAAINTVIASITPASITLTTALETVTGSVGKDTISGTVSTLSSQNTLQSGDKIDGGAGEDTLKVALNANFDGFSANGLTNVETIEITNAGTNDLTFNGAGTVNVTTYSVTAASGDVAVTNASSGVKTFNLKGFTSTTASTPVNFDFTFGAGASELSSTSNTATVNLANVGLVYSSTNGYRDAVLTLNGFQTVNLASTGVNSVKLDSTSLRTLNVSGSGSTDINAVNAGLTKFDASASTGDVYADLTAATALSSITVGSGDDTVETYFSSTRATATMAGGVGDDVLYLYTDGNANPTTEYAMSGFETLVIGSVDAANTYRASLAKTTDLSTVIFTTAVDGAVDFVSAGSKDLSFRTSGSTDNVTHTSDHTGATTVTFAAASTATAAAPSTPQTDFTFSKAAGALTVSVGARVDTNSTVITADKASSVTLTVASTKDTAGAEKVAFDNGSKIVAGEAKSITINASGSINDAQISAAKATTATVTVGETGGNLDLLAGKLEELSVKTGAGLTFNNGVAGTDFDLGSLQVLTVAADKGNTVFGDLAKVSTVTLSGSGATSEIDLGTLGGNNAYGLSVTASGLAASYTSAAPTVGLVIADMVVGSAQDISLDVKGVKSGVTVTNAIGNEVGQTPANVTIDGTGMTGKLTVGNVTGSANVKVLAAGAGEASVGNLTGASVTVDVSGTTAVSSVGTALGVKTALDMKLHALAAGQTYTVTAASGSTGLKISAQGGVNADNFVIDSRSGVANITMSGDLGAGTDTVTVNANFSTAKTIDLQGLTYDSSTIYGGSGIDTIKTGSGDDTIEGKGGADVITTGSGNDIIWVNATDSTYAAFDTINDLSSTDIINFGWDTVSRQNADVAGSTTKATISGTTGVATFELVTAKTTLAEKVIALNNALGANKAVYFTHDGSTFLFASTDGTDNGLTGAVIKLVGVSIPTLADDTFGTGTGITGLTGFGG